MMPKRAMPPSAAEMFKGAVPKEDLLSAEKLYVDQIQGLRNVLQTVAQMRKYQKEFFAAKDSETKKRCLIESKKLEQAVDMRLSEFGIREV